MAIGSLTFVLVGLACIAFFLWAVFLCREKGVRPIRDLMEFFLGQSKAGRILLGTFFIAMWVIASTKPGNGISPERSEHCEAMSLEGCGNGDGDGGGDGGTNNVPQMVCPPGGSTQMSLPGGMLQQQTGPVGQYAGLQPVQPLSGGATLNLSGFAPITSTNTLRTITADDFERGFVQTRIGTDERFDFSPPEGAAVCADWRSFGAATDWIYVAFTNWAFQVGTNDVNRMRVCSFGRIEPFILEADGTVATNNWFAPFLASIGVVPEANWGWLAGSDRPSQVWHAVTPENSLLVTWQNVLLGRDAARPLSFQAEFKPDGQFVYRYDLSRCGALGDCVLPDGTLTNFLIGASFAGNTWVTNSLPTNVTSMAFYPLSEEDILEQDRDGDGLALIDELFAYGTDPVLWDSDFDGLPDGVEIASGTNPAGRDSDNDGLVDGSDPDPSSTTPLDDLDGDGIPDAYEDHWFGGTNAVDSLGGYGGNGFNLGFALASGMNPTNGAEAAFMAANRVAAWKITDGFVAQTDGTAGNIYERTFRIARNGSWEQYFISSRPGAAGGWRLEGLALDWEDSDGGSGTANASPAGDSLYLPVSTNSPATMTLRLRRTAPVTACRTPLYLLAYSPGVEVLDAQQITTSNAVWTVATIKEETSVAAAVDRSGRPCRAALHPLEEGASFAVDGGGLEVRGDGTLSVAAPGVYRMPGADPAAHPAPVLRAGRPPALPPSTPGGHYLAFLTPSVSYGGGHHASGAGLGYDSGGYYETYEYPLDSGCLWRSFHSDPSGGYDCTCEPALSVGFDPGGHPDIATNLTVNGRTATGTVSIGGTQVWSDTATHDTSTVGWTSTELLSDDGCDTCDGCENGNCDAFEGDDIGSLKFRIPLGVPRRGQVSGFAWFMTREPLTIGIDTLQVLARDDAQVADTASGGTRTIACGDNRGRTLVIESVADGIRVTATSTSTGALEHTWELTNVNGSPSQIRIRKISRLDNTMSDRTYVCAAGDWTKFDSISQTSEELAATGDINEDGWKREERIVRDAGNAVLSHTVSESRRFGSFANAVLRQTHYAERTWGGDRWNESFASYYTDNDHPKRNGNVRLESGNARAWRFSAYDIEGRAVLTLDQHDGSWCPDWTLDYLHADAFDGKDVLQWLGGQRFTATATVCDYTPLAGDDADPNDADKVRTESRYLVDNGAVTLIGRTWTRYMHGSANGYATVTVETTTAGAQDAGIADVRNQHTTETRYDDDAPGIPLVLRGQTLSSTDADGITTENTYSIANNVLSQTSQKSYMSQSFPTSSHIERCMTYGNVLREWSVHTASGIAFDEREHLYDDKNRLVSTIYADGSFTTNAYSCCRLLWSQDRTGRKVLRSAVTGEDHLYYAMEEVSLGQLPNANGNAPGYAPYENYTEGDNHYRVTQHFMDALGRETNTVVRTCKTQGAAVNQSWNCSGWRTSETTVYPYGVSDYEVSTDMRGNETTTIHTSYSDCDYVETVETNKTTIVTTYRNGSSILYEEWPDGKWKETLQAKSYGANGCRIDTTTVSTSDHDAVTARTIYRDFLGRTVREVSPTADVAYTHDGASSRVLSTTDSASGETVMRIYDDLGEPLGQAKNGVTSRSETDYVVESNILWRVSAQTVAGTITNLCSVTKERLTDLSDELRRETFSYMNGALANHAYSSFDTTNSVLTEVVESAASGTTTTRSKYGIIIETTASAGTITSFFDPYGRAFYTEKDGRSVDWIGRNAYGDVEEYDTFHSEGDAYHAEFYGYDSFGNRIAATNALGAVTYSAYDAANRLAESGGAVYPVRNGYDTDGRRTSLTTFRTTVGRDAPIAPQGDTTTWTFDPATGFCTVKTYADGSTVTYTHTPDGLLLRETKPSGAWKENVYDAARQIVGVVSGDGAQDASMLRDEFGRVTVESNSVALATYSLDDCWGATNETQTVDGFSVSFKREFDAYGRLAWFARIGGEQSMFDYAPHGAISVVSNDSVAVEYAFTGDTLDAGYALAVQGGADFLREVFRHDYLRSCIVAVSNHCGNASHGLEYSYDALQRPVSRNADSFGYNVRGEVTSATIDGRNESHSYDDIGNAVQAAYPANTYDYTSNCRNQYSSIAATAGGTQLVESVSYDIDGNMTQHGEWTYVYDSGNRLVSVASNGITVATMSYDTQGRRVNKVAVDGTHRYFYDGWLLVYEYITHPDNTTTEVEYVWGKDISGTRDGAAGIGGLLYQKRDGVIYIPWYDAFGNILGYRDAQGNVVANYTYDAFGNIISYSGTMSDAFAFRFSTKYFDSDTDLYYYGYRYYKPQIMCWLTEDPTGEDGGVNLYAMCQNNLITLCDMLGLFSVYVHEEGAVGHVGILASNGFSYDYGRYHGTYSGLGLAFSGPNVLMTNKWDDVSSSHKYTTFHLNVCRSLDDAIVKVANRRFDNGFTKWPEDGRFTKFQKLTPNERYMGTDWSWNADNCITFTFRTIVSGVKEARDSGKLTGKAAKQAQTLLWLSFDACFQPRPKEIKSLLERYSRTCDWISISK